MKIKTKNLVSPWITKGLVKYSKRKQNLNEKLFRKRRYENKKQNKAYENVFEKNKKRSKKFYYQDKLS